MILKSYNYENVLKYTIISQILFSLAFSISSFVAFSDQYAGFVGILVGILFVGLSCWTYYCSNFDMNRTVFGAILGSCSVFSMISLQTAIFWGQLSNCSPIKSKNVKVTYKGSIGYECKNTDAMKSMCTFSVFIFLSYIALIGVLLFYKDDILGNEKLNEGYEQNSSAKPTYT